MRASTDLALAAALLFVSTADAESPRVLGVSDHWLLAHVRAPFAASCPANAGPTGLIVAGMEIAAGSPWATTEILEAPSLALAECAQRALLALRFQPPEGKAGERYRSKLMLYAVERSGGAIDLVPAPRMSPDRLKRPSTRPSTALEVRR